MNIKNNTQKKNKDVLIFLVFFFLGMEFFAFLGFLYFFFNCTIE